MLKIIKSAGVRVFERKPKPTLGISVTVIAFPPRSQDEQGGVIGIGLTRRLTIESMGSERVITARAKTTRKGRSIVTVLDLRLSTARMLRDALNKILDDSNIIVEVSDKPA